MDSTEHETNRGADYPTIDAVHDALTDEIAGVPEDRRPHDMPRGPRDAARWVLAHVLEPHQREEAPRLVNSKDGGTWRWTYLDRCVEFTRIFLRLSPEDQRYIIAAKEDGIPWRGDTMEFFRVIVAEHCRMQEAGAGKYRAEAAAKLRRMA